MPSRLGQVRITVDRALVSRVLLHAPLLGMLYLGILYGSFVTEPLVPADQVLLGRDAKEISDFVAIRFASELESIGLTLALIALAIGAALGVVALLLLVLRERLQGLPRQRKTGWRAALKGLALVVALHASALLLSMSRWPQLYVTKFWARGGVLAQIERLAVDRVRTPGLVIALAVALAVLLLGPPWRWPSVARRARGLSRRVLVSALVGLAAVSGLVLLVRAPPAVPPHVASATTPRRRSVLVLAADGLRNDHLDPRVAPHLSALAARGTRFDRAYIDVPRTMPSWATLLTGLHPHHHGVRTGFPRFEEVEHPLDSLPAHLRKAGYRTAVVSDYAGDVFGHADFGFDLVDVPPVTFPAVLREQAIQRSTPLLPFLQTRLGRAVVPEVARWGAATDPRFVAESAVKALRGMNDDPFFLVVFFSTTHFPYAAPAPYNARFTRPDYTGPFRYDKTVVSGVKIMPNAEDVTQIRGLYDGAVASVDDAVATVLDELHRTGADEDLVIVITSDHGEVLFEHDRWHGHGDHLFGDEGTHIPLVIVDPQRPARHEPALVASVDLAPTLYEMLGVAAPAHLDGRSLAPLLRGETLPSRPVFAETELLIGFNPGLADDLHLPFPSLNKLLEIDTDHGSYIVIRKDAVDATLLARQRMVRDERWKLIYLPTPTGVRYRLFDTASDPEELSDVSAAHPEEVERLKPLLWEWMLGDPLMTRDGDYLVPRGTRAPVPGQADQR